MTADPWGITQMKPTKSGGEEWFMNNNNFEGDSRVYGGEGFSIQSGFTVCDSSDFRASISTSTGFNDGSCTQNQQTMVDRGYMQAANDWKNTEFTAELQVFSSSSDHMTFGSRGARHTGSGGPRGCTGSNYKVSIDMNGNGVQLNKESWHVSYHDMGNWSVSGLDVDSPHRLKFLTYNTNNNTNVTIEVHIATGANNTFQHVFTVTDSGNVNNDAGECNCNNDGQPLVWGTPTFLIRGDAGSYGFRNVSVREIDPTGTGGGGGGGGGGTEPPPQEPSTVYASGNDGNVPENVIDKNLSTRWSNFGIGSWITLDLGSAKAIDKVGISWYQGSTRTNNYVISTSDDNTSFTSRKTGTSAGNTEAMETYDLSPDVTARYLRVTVNGNSSNDWASINEIEVYSPSTGGGTPPPGGGDPPPPPVASYNTHEMVFVLDYEEIGLCNPAGG